jgi:hypothetical protein
MNRKWNKENLSLAAARQPEIKRGDIVRSYDFPGLRDDCYIEGVVMAQPEEDCIRIHVTGEMVAGVAEQVSRFVVTASLGVSSMSGAPAVFLIAKRAVRA